MDYCPGLKPRRSGWYKPVWTSVFVVAMLAVMVGFYAATQKVDYIWRWNRVPMYFAYEDTVEIKAEIDGDVQSVKKDGDKTLVKVKGADGSETYTIPDGKAEVDSGDMVSVGDTLGSYTRWKAGLFLVGMLLTLEISLVAILIGIVLGVLTGLARISDNPALRWGAIVYIELIRGSPLLVQIFLWYFVFGKFINDICNALNWPTIPTIWYGVASLAVFAGAYVAEIVRAGIQSIHPGQMESARSTGMNAYQAMRYIILPQAFRRILPPLAGQFISLIKDSSLLGIIAIRELTKATREAVSSSYMPFELWFMCAILYLVLTFGLSMIVQYLERRTVQT